MKKYSLVLDLKNDEKLIEEYDNYHKSVWPEIEKSILEAGILKMEIYRYQNRLFMLMETEDEFSFEKKEQLDLNNPKVQEWEKLMWKYQQALPRAKPGEKWQLAKLIYSL